MKRRRLTKAEEETCRIVYRVIDQVVSDPHMSEDAKRLATGKLGRALWQRLAFFAPKPPRGVR